MPTNPKAFVPWPSLLSITEAENVAEQRVLEKAGFTREGVMRGVFWRDGAYRDGALYSLLRTDAAAGA